MPTFSLRCLVTALALAVVLGTAPAEEMNGLRVSISKRTIERNDDHSASATRYDRTQGLQMAVTNTSIREFPAGEVRWTIVVRRSSAGGLSKYTGKEVLKALHPSQATELVFGAAPTGGRRTEYANVKDRIEYEVIIVHEGKETFRSSSDSDFASLADRAVSMDPDPEEGRGRRRPRADPADPLPPPATPGTPDPTGKTPPATPATKPADPGAGKPDPAAPKTGDPAPADAPPAPPDAPAGKPFDFFNLDRKK